MGDELAQRGHGETLEERRTGERGGVRGEGDTENVLPDVPSGLPGRGQLRQGKVFDGVGARYKEVMIGQATVVAPASDALSDTELVELVRDGDDTAFEELYRRYQRRIAAFVGALVRNPLGVFFPAVRWRGDTFW
jgi:hypothetical protein